MEMFLWFDICNTLEKVVLTIDISNLITGTYSVKTVNKAGEIISNTVVIKYFCKK